MMQLYRSKLFNILFFLSLAFGFISYLLVFTLNSTDNSKKFDFGMSTTSVKCINKVCITYSGITECLNFKKTMLFKVSFEENINISAVNPNYSLELNSLEKLCDE